MCDRTVPVLIDALDFPLLAYLRFVEKRALTARELLRHRTENVRQVIVPLYDEFAELGDAIVGAKVRIRNLQKGAPATESLAAPQRSDALSTESESELFLLKKAYRAAAKLAHPDSGGSVHEFQAVYDAYRAKDLYALNCFVLSKQRPELSTIKHWLLDAERCRIAWIEFQATGEFRVATLWMRGQHDTARRIVFDALQAQLNELLHEERRLILREVQRP